MLTAKEALKLANESEVRLNEILIQIKDRADREYTSCYLRLDISEKTKSKLQELGYKVLPHKYKYFFWSEEVLIGHTISWEG